MKVQLFVILLFFCSLTISAQKDNGQLAQQIIAEVDAVDASLPQINILIKKGEKTQAKAMIDEAFEQLSKTEQNLKMVIQSNESFAEELPTPAHIQELKMYLANKANQLRYANVYIRCDAKSIDGDYSAFCEDVYTSLSVENVSFVDDASLSDWIITVTAKVREYNKADFGGMSSYFVYADVKTIIAKTSTEKRCQEKTMSEKGASPMGFENAAADAYKKVVPKISKVILEQIRQ